jgi:uncharacterized protein (TIGR00299 family) protein
MEQQKNTLYLECNSGISGDMAVAALLDLGADKEVLKKALKSIPIHGFRIKISRVKKAGLDVCDFHVILDEAHENHDHDMAYLFGERHTHAEEHGHGVRHAYAGEKAHGERHGYTEEHGHGVRHAYAGEQNHSEKCESAGLHTYSTEAHIPVGEERRHEHRGLPEILHIIRHTHMTEGAREIAVRIFRILAGAEAKAHGLPENEVHFHEVGAVDSIVDIISAAVCLDNLGITRCIVPGLCEGTGTIRCQHGIMNVPVPAVVNIVQAHQLKLSVTDIRGELVTPTGAAIVAAVKTADDLPESFRIIKTGMGGGKRAYERPSILRAMLIEDLDESAGQKVDDKAEKADKNREYSGEDSDGKDVIYKLESNIDDCSGEALGYVMDRLLEAGARDVHYMPVYMKKNRPAYQLNVICRKEQIPELENIIFAETTTIGIRRQRMERSVLPRRSVEIMTDLGGAVVKECRLPKDAGVRYYPEYDSIVKLCRISGKSYQEVYHLVLEQCKTGKNGGIKRTEKRNAKVHRFFGKAQK